MTNDRVTTKLTADFRFLIVWKNLGICLGAMQPDFDNLLIMELVAIIGSVDYIAELPYSSVCPTALSKTSQLV